MSVFAQFLLTFLLGCFVKRGCRSYVEGGGGGGEILPHLHNCGKSPAATTAVPGPTLLFTPHDHSANVDEVVEAPSSHVLDRVHNTLGESLQC